jgi:nitroreductase
MPISYDLLLELLSSRRSVRRFQLRPVADSALTRLLEAARWAPSASGRQAFRFFVVTDIARITEMRRVVQETCQRLVDEAKPPLAEKISAYSQRYFLHFGGAPTLIAAIYRPGFDLLEPEEPRDPREDAQAVPRHLIDVLSSVSAAVMNLLLAAESLGLGACWMTGPLVAAPELCELLEVPPGWQLAALVPVGYPDEDPPPPRRRELKHLVRWIR